MICHRRLRTYGCISTCFFLSRLIQAGMCAFTPFLENATTGPEQPHPHTRGLDTSITRYGAHIGRHVVGTSVSPSRVCLAARADSYCRYNSNFSWWVLLLSMWMTRHCTVTVLYQAYILMYRRMSVGIGESSAVLST